MVDSAAGCEFRDDLAALAARPPPRSGLPHAARPAASARHALARISRPMVLGAVRRRIPGSSDSGQAALDDPGAASGAGGRGRCGGRGRRCGFRAATSQAPGRGHRRRERRAKRRPPRSSASPPCAGNARARASSVGGADGAAHARDPSPRVRPVGDRRRGGAKADSDIDLPVRFDGPATPERFFGTQFHVEDLLGRPVDPGTERPVRAEIRPCVERDAIRVRSGRRLTPALRGRQTARRAGGRGREEGAVRHQDDRRLARAFV